MTKEWFSYPVVTYDGVFNKYVFYDTANDTLTPEEEKQIQEGIEQIKQGRCKKFKNIKAYLKYLEDD